MKTPKDYCDKAWERIHLKKENFYDVLELEFTNAMRQSRIETLELAIAKIKGLKTIYTEKIRGLEEPQRSEYNFGAVTCDALIVNMTVLLQREKDK